MGASDYVFTKGPNPPDFAQPNVNFDWVGNLPKQFQEGQQYARLRQIQTAFPQGLPRGPDGQVDVGAMGDTLARIGGAEAVGPLMQPLIGMSVAKQLMGDQPSGQGAGMGAPAPQPPQQPPGAMGNAPFAGGAAAASKNGAGPANLSSAGTDNQGQDSLSSVASEVFGDMDALPHIKSVAEKMKIDPAAPLDPARLSLAKQLLGREKLKLASAAPGIPAMGGGAAPAAPNDAGGNMAVAQAPAAPAAPPAPAASSATGLLPGDTQAKLANMRQAQSTMERKAQAASVFNKELSEQFKNSAASIKSQADALEGRLAKQQETQYGIGVKRTEEQQKTDVTQYSNLHKGLAGAGLTAAQSLQYIDIAKGIVNNPKFYSGAAEEVNLGYKRVLAGLGIDPGAALPQEAFRKVMAANILQQVNSLKAEQEAMGQQGGRIFASQIDLMEKAAQNPDNSVAANRYLTELADRSAKRSLAIADMADSYKMKYGSLDAGFEKQLRNWTAKNPMFTKAELADPSLVGAPPKAKTTAPEFRDDMTATNPKTGEKLIRKNGKWVPLI